MEKKARKKKNFDIGRGEARKEYYGLSISIFPSKTATKSTKELFSHNQKQKEKRKGWAIRRQTERVRQHLIAANLL